MNVLFVFLNDNTNGGAVSIMRQIAEYYLANGADVHMLFLTKKQYGHWDNVDNMHLHLYYSSSKCEVLKHIRYLHLIEFDYSFSSVVKFTGLIGILRRLGVFRIKRMVARESTSIFNRFSGLKLFKYKLYYKFGYKAVSILICQTSIMREQLLKNLPWLEKYAKVIVIPNPVNIQKMNEKAKEEIDVIRYKPYIVTAGRFIPEKAYDVLLDSFAKVVQRKPKMKLVFLGDGNLRSQIEAQIERLNLNKNVELVGQVDNVYPWFKMAKLCVVSSRLEGFPNVLLQMMSQNDKVVSTLCAGDIDRIDGLVTCQTEDADALATAMLQCMDDEAGNRRELFDKELQRRSIENFIYKVEHS